MIGIIETGVSLGEHIQTNIELANIVNNYESGASNKSLDEWIREHYGILSRIKTDKMPSTLAVDACKQALNNSSIPVSQIDFLILNTTSGDYKQPTTATIVQKLIEMKEDSFAIEINMPCAGNIYGLTIAYSFIQSGLWKTGLVVGVDKMSTIIDEKDFKIAGMFGDAASACIIGENPKYEIKDFFLKSKMDEIISLGIKSSGSAFPLTEESVRNKEHLLKMKGNETADFIYKSVQETILSLLEKACLEIHEVDQLIIHQASKTIINRTIKQLGFTEKQICFTVDTYGNTSSASIFLTLDYHLKQKQNSKNIFLVGMGSGLNWGGVYLKKNAGYIL